jgi:hypothetical protein
MADRPGDGCKDPRAIHLHICGDCGHQQSFSSHFCRDLEVRLHTVPHCPVCGGYNWRYEIDPQETP